MFSIFCCKYSCLSIQRFFQKLCTFTSWILCPFFLCKIYFKLSRFVEKSKSRNICSVGFKCELYLDHFITLTCFDLNHLKIFPAIELGLFCWKVNVLYLPFHCLKSFSNLNLCISICLSTNSDQLLCHCRRKTSPKYYAAPTIFEHSSGLFNWTYSVSFRILLAYHKAQFDLTPYPHA